MNFTKDKLAVIATTVLIGAAAIFVSYSVNHNYRSSRPIDSSDSTNISSGSGPGGQMGGLQAQSSINQSVNAVPLTQLQTSSSSMQQAMPNSPQNAGTSNPVGPYYCDDRNYMDCTNPY